ncbi:MAG: zf-HC2 domain-containing protein [Candidatus Omnitrophica bacterium]|nr:zf-HC2 domain-containing protein [Candidatus Omnitrophota bacterium]MCM8828305.1 zf-HC2 domain-containing protein [Candidatus Omnitrophota bacterium]
MKCEEIKNKIIEFVDGGLSDVERTDIEKHLNECHRCREEFESIKMIFSSAKQIKVPVYDETFWNSRYNTIFEKAQRRVQREHFTRRMRLGFGLLGIFLMIFTSRAYYHKYRTPVPVNVPEISYYVPEEVLSEKTLPISVNDLKRVVDFLEPEEHMMILAEYLR